MKLLAVVITYYPNIVDTIINIKQYVEKVDRLVIWENTPLIDRDKYHFELPEFSNKITYKSTGRNEGISFPLNSIIEYGIRESYSHLLTMDQDSYWINFHDFILFIEECKNHNILAYCPQVTNVYEREQKQHEPIKMEECITSGTIYSLKACSILGKFDEKFVIDAVDLEYCYRGRKLGYDTLMLPVGTLNHKLGNPKKICNRWVSSNYSTFRTFHIIRNHIWVWKKYPEYFSKKEYLYRETILRFFYIIIGEKSKLKKILAIIRGIISGIFFK